MSNIALFHTCVSEKPVEMHEELKVVEVHACQQEPWEREFYMQTVSENKTLKQFYMLAQCACVPAALYGFVSVFIFR